MSIRVRLTVWYVSLLAIALIIFSTIFYGIFRFSLYNEVDRTLQDRANQIRASIATENTPLDVLTTGQIRLPELDVFSSPSIYIQITDAQGEVKTLSQNIERMFVISDSTVSTLFNQIPAVIMSAVISNSTVITPSGSNINNLIKSQDLVDFHLPIHRNIISAVKDGNPLLMDAQVGMVKLRIYSAPLWFGNQVIGIVQVGQPLTEVEATLRRILFSLVSGTVITLIIATLLGALMAHISLQPIEQITMSANKIVGAEDLRQRLPVAGTNDELDRLRKTINGMLTRLDDFFQAQVNLSADISHELRTPLTIIRGYVALLRDDVDETPEERAETMTTIDRALDRMARLVSDLLLLSQADAGMSLAMTDIDLGTLIFAVYQEAQVIADKANIEIRLGHEDYAFAHGDPDRLKQALFSLINYAIDYTPPGGDITLSFYRELEWVHIIVTDTGPGINSEDLPHVFDRFYRPKSQKRKGSGLGLGLANAKWIAEAHGGTLTVESQTRTGNTFILRLPLILEVESKTPETKTIALPTRA